MTTTTKGKRKMARESLLASVNAKFRKDAAASNPTAVPLDGYPTHSWQPTSATNNYCKVCGSDKQDHAPTRLDKATPRPWRVEFANSKRIYSANNKIVAEPYTIHRYENGVESTDDYEAYANAALIVQAVNSFTAMRNALQRIADAKRTDGQYDKHDAAGFVAIAEAALADPQQ